MFSAFDSIRIISLPDRLDRRAEIGKEMARVGLAVDVGPVRMFDAIRPAEAAGFPSVGARGCYLSHLQVLREALETGTKHLMVFEDDALFTREIKNAEALLGLCMSDDWDFLYPGHLMLPAIPGPLHWIPKDDWLMCTHAYAVNRRVLKPLVAYLENALTQFAQRRCAPEGGASPGAAGRAARCTQGKKLGSLEILQVVISAPPGETAIAPPGTCQALPGAAHGPHLRTRRVSIPGSPSVHPCPIEGSCPAA